MKNQNLSILQKTYHTVAPACFDYFKAVWLARNKKCEKTFRNRMKNPTTRDIILFCHVCNQDILDFIKPLQRELKNIPPFDSSPIQLTLN
ncbi:hypothetical protein [Emticicia sp. 17c]|uniref:hypothetical protein n=1 Tax=Emticicia sp. 17c TaxID=3127704 RepID=UPI00301C7348